MKVNRTGATAVIRPRSRGENGREGTPDGAFLPRPARIATSGAVPAGSNFDTGVYFYDGAGNITAMGGDTFGYDRLSRLTSGNLSGLGNQGFSYDRYGNLTGTTGVNPRSYSVSNQYNRLTNASYDSRGNLLTIGSETYTWDALDRTTRYQAPSSVDWKYLYDGAGERLVKIPTSGATADYVWTFRDEGNRVATEYIGPIVSRDNVYFGNLLVGSYASCAANGPPGWTYYSSDHLGTPRLITDANANVLDSRKYWPYGDEAQVTQPTSSQRLRFASMERDAEASRYYDHARSYDYQGIGRFLGVDLLSGRPDNPQSLNRYAYVLGNPLGRVDRFGLQSKRLNEKEYKPTVFTPDGVYSGNFQDGVFIADENLASQFRSEREGSIPASAQNFWESLIPIWGSANEAGAEFEAGNWGLGALYVVLALSDVSGVKSLAEAGGKALIKGGLRFSRHALGRLGREVIPGVEAREAHVTDKMIEMALRRGTRHWDPLNRTEQFLLPGAMASGKDLLVARNPITDIITTVLTDFDLLKARFVPLP